MTGKEIADAVNKIIEELDPNDFKEAVNWGDLSVCTVEKRETLYPIDGRRADIIVVTIEEASPDCDSFCEEISTMFYNLYKIFIDVKTEW